MEKESVVKVGFQESDLRILAEAVNVTMPRTAIVSIPGVRIEGQQAALMIETWEWSNVTEGSLANIALLSVSADAGIGYTRYRSSWHGKLSLAKGLADPFEQGVNISSNGGEARVIQALNMARLTPTQAKELARRVSDVLSAGRMPSLSLIAKDNSISFEQWVTVPWEFSWRDRIQVLRVLLPALIRFRR